MQKRYIFFFISLFIIACTTEDEYFDCFEDNCSAASKMFLGEYRGNTDACAPEMLLFDDFRVSIVVSNVTAHGLELTLNGVIDMPMVFEAAVRSDQIVIKRSTFNTGNQCPVGYKGKTYNALRFMLDGTLTLTSSQLSGITQLAAYDMEDYNAPLFEANCTMSLLKD